jgi:uncharacterized protein
MTSPSASTNTTAGARTHARAQAGTAVQTMPTIPASASADPPEGVDRSALIWAETIAGGGYASKVLARGTRIRLTDLEGDACANVALFSATGPFERLSVADTVKVEWNAYLSAGSLLLSDQGRVLASIVEDSSTRHDTMAGPSTRTQNVARYGSGLAGSSSPAGRELLILAAAKHGLEPRDIPATVAFFQGVTVEPNGALRFDGSVGPGSAVDLLAELPIIVLIANAMHPLDPRSKYCSSPLAVTAWRSQPTAPDDEAWSATPEGTRAFLNTADFLDAAVAP